MLASLSSLLLKLFNMSVTACFIALAVILLRMIFKKVPKFINCLLWGLVALRLICPFSIESVLSLVPSRETFPESIISDSSFEINSGINAIDAPINDYLGDHYYEGVTVPENTGASVMELLSIIWLAGVFLMLLYAVISVIRIKKGTDISKPLGGCRNVYLADNIDTAFILGFVKPKIYIPSSISEDDISLVLAHENAHIKRLDHFIKPLGFLLLSVYWFNPVIWACYILFCKDVEGACDERVLKTYGDEVKKDYSKALIKLSTKQRQITACPLAFGETGVKGRVINVLNYKKPAFWVVAVAVASAVVASVCFLTNPLVPRHFPNESKAVSDIDTEGVIKNIQKILDLPEDTVLYSCADTCDIILDGELNIYLPTHIQFYYEKKNKTYGSQLQILYNEKGDYYVTEKFKTDYINYSIRVEDYLNALKYLPKEKLKAMTNESKLYHINLLDYTEAVESEKSIIYSKNSAAKANTYSLHLQAIPFERTANDDGFASYGDYADLYFECEYEPIAVNNYRASTPSKTVKSDNLEEAIHLALLSDNPKDRYYNAEYVTEGHIVYGKSIEGEKSGNIKLSVFVYQDIRAYSFLNGDFAISGGSSCPAVIVFDKANGQYVLREIRYPHDGDKYGESIKKMMPDIYSVKAIKGPSKRQRKEISNQCISQASEYLRSIGRTAEIHDYGTLTALRDVFDITSEQEDALYEAIGEKSYFNFGMGNYETVLDGTRYVFETEYDLKNEKIILTKYEYETKRVKEYYEVDIKSAEYVKNPTVPKFFEPINQPPIEVPSSEYMTVAASEY